MLIQLTRGTILGSYADGIEFTQGSSDIGTPPRTFGGGIGHEGLSGGAHRFAAGAETPGTGPPIAREKGKVRKIILFAALHPSLVVWSSLLQW